MIKGIVVQSSNTYHRVVPEGNANCVHYSIVECVGHGENSLELSRGAVAPRELLLPFFERGFEKDSCGCGTDK